jgi:hypothetical protein
VPRGDGHAVECVHQVAALQAAHTHATGWLGAREAHARQVAGGVVPRSLSVSHLSGAS